MKNVICRMRYLIIFLFLISTTGNSYSNDERYKDYKSKLSAASTDQKYLILKEINFALDFENDVISSCVGYIKMWKETKGKMCSKAFNRLKGITNLMAVLSSNEFKSSFREVAKKVNKLKLDQLMKETEKNSTALLDNISKLNFLIRNL